MIGTLALRPMAVDSWRVGGAWGGRNFFLGQASQGQAKTLPVDVGASTTADIRTLIDGAIQEIDFELEVVMREADLVTGASLRVEPTAYTDISVIGTVFIPQEIRSNIAMDARELDALAARLRTGALSHYLSPEEAAAVDALRLKAKKIVDFIEGQDLVPIQPGHESLAETHTQSHLEKPKAAIEKAERAVVGAEAGAVPVREPYEKTLGTVEIMAGVGVLAVVGVAIWGLLS